MNKEQIDELKEIVDKDKDNVYWPYSTGLKVAIEDIERLRSWLSREMDRGWATCEIPHYETCRLAGHDYYKHHRSCKKREMWELLNTTSHNFL